jgi:diaminopimelate decarboxylase
MTHLASTHANCSSAVTVEDLVTGLFARRDGFLQLAAHYGSPLYIIEEATLRSRAHEFTDAFRAQSFDIRVFFPVKANSHPLVLNSLIPAGLGLEVSSGVELDMALAAGAREILFNGPAKTDAELRAALQYRDLVTVILDSATEFDRLEALAVSQRTTIRAGVRLTVEAKPLWRKFGIPLSGLECFVERTAKSRHVLLKGLHFHTSWNMNPSVQVSFIQQLGETVRRLPAAMRARFEFIDIGGGFWPPQGEWLPATPFSVPSGREGFDSLPDPSPSLFSGPFYTTTPAAPIAQFAGEIAEVLTNCLFGHTPLQVYAEPGRWICNDAAHILLTVLDRKDDIAITDGGTNSVGWERFEHEYFPVINLSRPEVLERPFLVLGSLCTPHDVWGRSCFGADIRIGDRLLIPHQGAYTYSLRQQFIKPLPTVVFLQADGVAHREGDAAACR